MIENFGPGTIGRLGLDYEAVSKAHPHIVFLSLKGFLPGPYEKRAALDEVVQMMSGLAYMTGPPGQPLRAGASVVDVLGGMFGVIGVLVALRERDATGKGTLVRASLFESAMFLMGQHLAYAALSDEPVPPMPARVSAWAIYDLFDAAGNEKMFLGITSDRHWALFCEEFARPDLAADASLATNNQRITEKPRLKAIIADMLRDMSVDEIAERCTRAKLPFAHVARPEQLFDDAHLLAGHRLLETRLPGGIGTRLPALPIEIGGYKCALRSDPPETGAHTRAILADAGYPDAVIEDLLQRGLIAEPPRQREKSAGLT